MRLSQLKENNSIEIIEDWCLTIYDYLLSLHPDFFFETQWFKGVLAGGKKNLDIKLMKRVYKETNVMVRETLTPDSIEPLNQLLKEKFGHNIADEIDRETALIEKIIKRGKIRNDREFEMVKRREEEIYADESQNEYAETLRKLMGDYECPQLSVRSD